MRRRPFWIILFATIIAWLGYTMSEQDDYPLQLRVEWQGIDTARYVVTHSDTLLPVTVKSNCFQAIKHQRLAKQRPFVISAAGDTSIAVGQSLFDNICTQLNFDGTFAMYSSAQTLRLSVSKRQGRAFVPQLRNITLNFDDHAGLAGQPRIEPDTIWLYGSPASLAKINEIVTSPTTIDHIADSGYYVVNLDPIWKEYRDLRSSHDFIRVYLPVQRFAEVKLKVPVTFRSNSAQRVQLYPSHVEVTLWAPIDSYKQISSDYVTAVVDYQPSAEGRLPVLISQFPAQTRIKQVQPASVEYVIIK
ncbi:MAG: hypothetical protein MJZ86_05685 [Bacteroidales bacterium]|nr:hypothetical protein [Bacteroidales bacterium]